MTRLESGALKPRTSLIELSDVIGAALQRAAKILADHRVEVDLPPDLPMLALDMVLFEQVLFNLLDNAAKHAPAGSLITIAGQPRRRHRHPAHHGRGRRHPARRSSTASSRNSTAPAARDRRRAGTGLGLAICRGFVEAMDGTITAANRTDRRGAMFTITLPVPVDAPLPEEEDAVMTAGAGPLRVLVVDDEPAIRRFLRAGLSSQGYVVSELETGLPAVDVARRKGTDLIVLDLGLPDIDGIEVIGRIRAAGSPVPIIVLSSRNDEAAKVDALDLGADDYVTKPFGIDELLARIRAAQRHRLQQRRRDADLPQRRPDGRSGAPDRHGARRGGEVLAARIRRAAAAGAARRQGADPQDDPARGLGRRHRRAIPAYLHPGAAAENRGGPGTAGPYPDGNRRWVSLADQRAGS